MGFDMIILWTRLRPTIFTLGYAGFHQSFPHLLSPLIHLFKPGEVKGESTLTKTGGEGEIRTLESPFDDHTLSKRALSTTQTPLQKFAPQISGSRAL